MHLVLLGDSVFDNGCYTGGAPDVAAQLRSMLDPDCRVTLLARDGATTGTFENQLLAIPRDATHLILSLGGNDALGCLPLLQERVANVGHGLFLLGERVQQFEEAYKEITERLPEGLALMVCTIYGGDFEGDFALTARTALAPFNDAILRVAFHWPLDVLDLRQVCVDPRDFVRQIEPSAQGGEKIARAIADRVIAYQLAEEVAVAAR